MDPEVHMNTQSMHGTIRLLPLLALALLWSGPLPAQVPVDDEGNPVEALDDTVNDQSSAEAVEVDEAPPLTPQELEELVGPIALYPDKLLAIVLPASTYPLEIVQAARFLDQLEDDSSLKPDESWDDSVTALLNYPEVVRMMNDDIDWTWRLGEAVVRQQTDVIAAVESFRDKAYAAGNLKTDERQKVSNSGGTIEIAPLEEDVIYVPYYEPERVVYYQPRQVYYYYEHPYPVYYYPYPAYHPFLSGYFWGVTTAFNIGWTTDHLYVFHHSYWGHPYYGRQYFGNYYRRPSIVVYNTYYVNNHHHRPRDHHRDGDYWRPRDGGPRPGHYRARLERFNDQPRERTVEGYRVPDRTGGTVARDSNRAGFSSDGGSRVRSATRAREGFASSRGGSTAQNRQRPDVAAGTRQADGSASSDAPIRFRSRDRVGVPAQSERSRSPDTAERSSATRSDTRRDSNDGIRFRPRDNTDSRTSLRPRAQVTPSIAFAEAPRASAAERSAGSDRSTVRQQATTRNVAPRAAAPATRGFQASPGRSAPAARPNVSQPQASSRAAPPRASTPAPAPRSSASPPARAPKATPAPARQDRAAPRRGGRTPSARTSREK
jgi:hypothetical protein